MKINLQNITPRPSVMWFAKIMEYKLAVNDAKKGGQEVWRNDDPQSLHEHLVDEVNELECEVENFTLEGDKYAEDLALEAADVANMAMMVADACVRSELAIDANVAAKGKDGGK